LTDITFLEDGNADKLDGDLVNFNKMRMIADKIRQVRQYQYSPYKFSVEPHLRHYLQNLKAYDDNELYHQSLKIEPKKEKK